MQLSAVTPVCPVCGSACTGAPLSRYSPSQAAAHFCPPARHAERYARLTRCIERLWANTVCEILACSHCTFMFAHPFVGGDEEFYDILHEQQGYPAWRWDYDVAIAATAQPSMSGRIIDIGAGTGIFLRSLGNTWQKFATEGGEVTRAALERQGIRVFRDLGDLVAAESGTFDVVTMFQLLEHIADFRVLLAQCRSLLRPGGKLIITVPHGDAMMRQERLTGCPDMPPFHVNKWTPRSLAHALCETGVEYGDAEVSPSKWRNIAMAMQLRIVADASKPRSLAAQAYRVKRKALRVPLLAALGVPALLKMLPCLGELRLGGSFAMVATMAAGPSTNERTR